MQVEVHHIKGEAGGGYTVAVKQRPDGQFAASICQCRPDQEYNPALGEAIATGRLKRGMFLVRDKEGLRGALESLEKDRR